MIEVYDSKDYTEAKHTVYASVKNADPVEVEGRRFTPERVIVHYGWRTQLGNEGWNFENIEISGRWIDDSGEPTGTGSGRIICGYVDAPRWAQIFAGERFPAHRLILGGRP